MSIGVPASQSESLQDHSLTAVVSLPAVCPNRLGSLDGEVVCREDSGIVSDRHATKELSVDAKIEGKGSN